MGGAPCSGQAGAHGDWHYQQDFGCADNGTASELRKLIAAADPAVAHLAFLGDGQDAEDDCVLWQTIEDFADKEEEGAALARRTHGGGWACADSSLQLLYDYAVKGRPLAIGNQYSEYMVKVIKAMVEQRRRDEQTAGVHLVATTTQPKLVPRTQQVMDVGRLLSGQQHADVGRASGTGADAERAAAEGAAAAAANPMAGMEPGDEGGESDEEMEGEVQTDLAGVTETDLPAWLVGKRVAVRWACGDGCSAKTAGSSLARQAGSSIPGPASSTFPRNLWSPALREAVERQWRVKERQ